MARTNFFNQLTGGSQQASAHEDHAQVCAMCFGRGVDYDFGGPCPKGCAPVTVRRESAKVPGLVLERTGWTLTFRQGLGFVRYDVSAGNLVVLDRQDGGYLRPLEREVIVATARAYARKAVAA